MYELTELTLEYEDGTQVAVGFFESLLERWLAAEIVQGFDAELARRLRENDEKAHRWLSSLFEQSLERLREDDPDVARVLDRQINDKRMVESEQVRKLARYEIASIWDAFGAANVAESVRCGEHDDLINGIADVSARRALNALARLAFGRDLSKLPSGALGFPRPVVYRLLEQLVVANLIEEYDRGRAAGLRASDDEALEWLELVNERTVERLADVDASLMERYNNGALRVTDRRVAMHSILSTLADFYGGVEPGRSDAWQQEALLAQQQLSRQLACVAHE